MSDVTEYNHETGETTFREYTKEELKIRKKDSESEKPFLAQDEQSIAENIINLRNSAINKLKTLGLTEDEAKAIVGI